MNRTIFNLSLHYILAILEQNGWIIVDKSELEDLENMQYFKTEWPNLRIDRDKIIDEFRKRIGGLDEP